jgi:hypothetical protein
MSNFCAFTFRKRKGKLDTDEMWAAERNFLTTNLTCAKFGR